MGTQSEVVTKASGLQILRDFDPVDYARSRNYVGFSSRISQHLTRGVLTMPEVLAELSSKASVMEMDKFVFELAWREYYQRVWDIKGRSIFEDLKWPQPTAEREGIPVAVIEARTGIKALDHAITKLYDTGYIHNHERMWLAGLVCNIAKCHWRDGADWMFYYLKDGDLASNHLSWQWVAGSFSSKPYLPAQSNINTFAEADYGELGTYLDYKYDKLAKRQIPGELVEVSRFDGATILPDATMSLDEVLELEKIQILTPWTLDPDAFDGQKICLVDPTFFEQHPVADQVMKSIIATAAEIDGCKVLIATPDQLERVADASVPYYPLVHDYPGFIGDPAWLFPEVEHKLYASFTSFWKHAEPLLPELQRSIVSLKARQ